MSVIYLIKSHFVKFFSDSIKDACVWASEPLTLSAKFENV